MRISTVKPTHPPDTYAWHAQCAEDVLSQLGGDLEKGLNPNEVERKRIIFGPNRLSEEKRISFWGEFIEELREPLILLLIATGVIYAVLGEPEDALVIFFVILALNTVEVVNELRAKKAIQTLRKLAEPTASVLRGGQIMEIHADSLVPGDVILLHPGRRVPADARLLESFGLAVDESSLTGESMPTNKDAGVICPEEAVLAERENMVYSGCLLTRGHGRAVVTGTGMTTELGRVAGLARAVKEPRTPLQEAMSELSRWLVWLALGFSILIPLLGVLIARQPLEVMLLTGLALAFATIPEEMPIIITMVLALGAYRLSKQNAIIKHLKAVETIGAVTVIATDKTGTLTENRLAVAQLLPEEATERLLQIGAGCCENSLYTQKGEGLPGYDPMETALLLAARSSGIDPDEIQVKHPLVSEFTFDNRRKRMSVVRLTDERLWICAKGAPESLLKASTNIWTPRGEILLSEAKQEETLQQATEMATKGLRVIALAERTILVDTITQEEAERQLTFVGLAGFADPPRPEAKDALAEVRRAGIHVKMITGDHPLTAESIARQIGLDTDNRVRTGNELDELEEESLRQQVGEIAIIARTSPEQKLRIVQALMANGERVAVTGDGVNDAPALVAADIGVAMGYSGSDVAREAADIILADDNFTTIVNAVREGRALFENLRKGVRYYLACKVALVSITLLPVLLAIPLPFAPIQIILMELFMDLAAAAAFVAEPSEGELMDRPPRNPKAPFIDRDMVLSIFSAAAGLFAAVSAVYLTLWYSGAGQRVAQTAAFAAWMLGHVLLAFNLRSYREPLVRLGLGTNRLMLIWGSVATLFVILTVSVPGIQSLLKTAPLSVEQWGLVIVAVFTGTFWMEVVKWVCRRNSNWS